MPGSAPAAQSREASIQAIDTGYQYGLSIRAIDTGLSPRGRGAGIVDMKLEVVVLPVADVDRAKWLLQEITTRLPGR